MTEQTKRIIKRYYSFEPTAEDVDLIVKAFSYCKNDKEQFKYIWEICEKRFTTSPREIEDLAKTFKSCNFDKEKFEKILLRNKK